MITLNIRYDPMYEGCGMDPCAQEDFYAKEFPPDHPPLFPYDGLQSLGFKRHEVTYGAHDPWSGTRWTFTAGNFSIIIENVMVAQVTVSFGRYTHTWLEYEWSKMPAIWRRLVAALDYRYEWFQVNEYREDPCLEYYGRNL